jgi:HlyD family secretion protein
LEKKKPMKNKIILPALFVFAFTACSEKGDTVHPARKDITHAVYASGKLFPHNHYTVLSKFPGYVEQIFVKAGDTVIAGQPLIAIRNEANDFSIASARNLAALAKDNADENGSVLAVMKQEVAAAKSKYELDSLNFVRMVELWKNSATSKLNYDQCKTQFDASRALYVKAQENLYNSRERLKVESLNAENQLSALLSNKSDYRILSAISGKVYDVLPEIGDLVAPPMPLLEVGNAEGFETELAVDETDVSFLQEGLEVVYSIDAFHDKFFKGKIVAIYPRVNPASKTARVKATFVYENDVQLFSGMSVEANIVISEKKNAIVIPREFLKNGKVKVKGDDNLREVKTGVSDLQFVEIISGISENNELLKQ